MLASDPAGSVENESAVRNEAQFPDEARRLVGRVHRQITQLGRHLAVRHLDWATDGIGLAVYMYTLWILRWEINESMGRKINRRSQVAAELEIPIGR